MPSHIVSSDHDFAMSVLFIAISTVLRAGEYMSRSVSFFPGKTRPYLGSAYHTSKPYKDSWKPCTSYFLKCHRTGAPSTVQSILTLAGNVTTGPQDLLSINTWTLLVCVCVCLSVALMPVIDSACRLQQVRDGDREVCCPEPCSRRRKPLLP